MNLSRNETGRFTIADCKYDSCVVSNCNRPILNKIKGLCRAHYLRLIRHGDPELGKPIRETKKGEPLKWMQEHLNYDGDDCLIFPFCGNVFVNSKRIPAYVWVCEKINGPAPKGKQAAHSCGNGHLKCVNRNHLSWKTVKQNAEDREKHGRTSKGEGHQPDGITEAKAIEIYKFKGKDTFDKAAKIFEVSKSTIADIWRGSTWAWLTGANGGENLLRKGRRRKKRRVAL